MTQREKRRISMLAKRIAERKRQNGLNRAAGRALARSKWPWTKLNHWYEPHMLTDSKYPIFEMELSDTILKKVRRKIMTKPSPLKFMHGGRGVPRA
jgi:hypothetical protein